MPPRLPRPLIIAHRGASAAAPENTLPAFQAGIAAEADGVEFDVRLAKDGVTVVIHDRDLRRVAARKELIADLTSDHLAEIDIGRYWNKKRPQIAKPEFAGAGVPTLARVLDLYGNTRNVIHIELKVDRKREVRPLVTAVCDTIRDSPLLPNIVLSSFRLTVLSEAKFLLPQVKTSALFAPSIMRVLKRRRHIIALARAFGADQISPHRSLITKRFAGLAREVGMPVNIWTCDAVKWVKLARDLNIHSLMTNDPARLIAYRDSLTDED